MRMIESEARTKDCVFLLSALLLMTIIMKGRADWTGTEEDFNSIGKCRGSDCMMWEDDRVFSKPSFEKAGHCGLVKEKK
jgi:hypothetical protein